MATSPVAPAGTAEELTTQSTIFNLDTMEQVTLKKTVTFEPVRSAAEFTERLGNDTVSILKAMNDGLRTAVYAKTKEDNGIPWMVETEDGKLEAFSGTPANMEGVNNLVLSLAKQIFGYSKDKTPEEKKAAKDSAVAFIRANDQIREGLKKNAAL